MPRPESLPTKEAHEALDQYIFARDPRCAPSLPKNIDPADLPRYLQDTVVDALKGSYCWRLFDVMDWYDAAEQVRLLAPFMDKDERQEDTFDRSICYDFASATLGRASDKQAALDYYDYLLTHRRAKNHLTGLIQCYGALLLDLEPTSPQGRIQSEMDRLEPQAEQDEDADAELSELDDLLESNLPELEGDVESVRRILAIRSSEGRLDALARTYVGLNPDLGPTGEESVERILRRAGREDGASAVDAFRALMESPKFKGEDAADTRMMRVLALRAIDFFGGSLDDKELRAIRKQTPTDASPLSWI